MRIAIQAADLDNSRIDGTRVYLWNVLKEMGKISAQDTFFIYHKKKFNKELRPPKFSNYREQKIEAPFFWTQTAFAWNIWKKKIDVLWMPMHNIPITRSKKLKTVVTIHDLAFKRFPDSFPKKELIKLNLLTGLAVKNADKIIAVSNSTKKDILKFYPNISENKIKVIYHGFDRKLFEKKLSDKMMKITLRKFQLKENNYLLYVGAIQPRKNLKTLVKAFEIYKKKNNSSIKLVLAGERAWNWENTISTINSNKFRNDIVLTGKISFKEVAILYRKSSVFIFPSLYEGFGIPILEAFASGVPVVSSRNSSLIEVGGDAVEFFNEFDSLELSGKIEKILKNDKYRETMIESGFREVRKFSWNKCARETLKFLKS